jgi:hypothetical protein
MILAEEPLSLRFVAIIGADGRGRARGCGFVVGRDWDVGVALAEGAVLVHCLDGTGYCPQV